MGFPFIQDDFNYPALEKSKTAVSSSFCGNNVGYIPFLSTTLIMEDKNIIDRE